MGRHVLMKTFRVSRMILAGILIAGCSPRDVRSILAEARDVIADPETFPQVSKIHTSAECTGPNGPFRTEIWSAKDGSVRFEQHSSRGATIAGIGESGSWILDDHEVTDLDLPTEVFLRGHELHILALYPLSRFEEAVDSGEALFMGQRARKVQFRDALGNPVDIYYDLSAHHPVGIRVTSPFESAPEDIQVVLQDWKRLDNGLFFFTKASFHQGGEVWTHKYSMIDINGFDSAVFDPP